MSEPVQISVRNSLSKVIEELEKIRQQADATSDAFKGIGNEVEEGLRNNTKKTETFLGNLRGLGGRVANQLRGDFKSLFAINAVTDALKISNQFKGSVADTIELSDKVRKLGAVFGIAGSEFATFQANLQKGLGQIGLSSDVATKALEGLSTTQVRGETNILEYSKNAGMLASISGETGKEGDIAAQLARVISARGADVNDPKNAADLSESVRKAFDTTGQKPSAILQGMEQIFSKMPTDQRRRVGSEGLANLAAVNAAGGPNATKFLEQYLGMSKIQRMAIDAQGGADLVGDKGLDTERFAQFAKSITSRIGMDPRMAAQTLGLDEDAAEGFIRLAENIKKVEAAQDKINNSTGSLESQYKSTMGAAEAFRASLNRLKGALADPMAKATQGATDILQSASGSTAGAGAVVAGGGLLAAVLAGAGTKILGKTLGGAGGAVGTVAKTLGAEQVLGEKTIPVYVTNAAEIGGGAGLIPGAAGGSKLGQMANNAGLLTLAAGIGVGIGSIIEPFLKGSLDKTEKKKYGGVDMDLGDRIGYVIDKITGGGMAKELDERENKNAISQYGIKAVDPDAPAKAPGRQMNDGEQSQPAAPLRGGDRIESTAPQGPIIVPAPPVVQPGTVPTQSNNGSGPASAFGQAPIKVEVYTKDTGLSLKTRSPSTGASN